MALLLAAEDAIAEAKAQLDNGQRKASWKSAIRAAKALEDFKSRVRPEPRGNGPDPRQMDLPHTRNLSEYMRVHEDDEEPIEAP